MRRHDCHEVIEVYGAVDHVCAKTGGDWSYGSGGVPEAWNQRGGILQLEVEV